MVDVFQSQDFNHLSKALRLYIKALGESHRETLSFFKKKRGGSLLKDFLEVNISSVNDNCFFPPNLCIFY